MHLEMHLMFLIILALQLEPAKGGRAQRKQRQAEERLRPYWGRTEPEKLCQLLKCHSPIGSLCQVVTEGSVSIPKCICPQTCPGKGEPVCSVLGKTYGNECLLYKEACRKRRRNSLAHRGPCHAPRTQCTEAEYSQFPYRLMDWFLLLKRMGESYSSPAPPLSCLSDAQRRTLAERRFAALDRNGDGRLSHRDLKKLHYKQMPLEHCARRFFHSCDSNGNRKVTLREWIGCLVVRTETWFQDFTSMKMGSKKLCPARHNNV